MSVWLELTATGCYFCSGIRNVETITPQAGGLMTTRYGMTTRTTCRICGSDDLEMYLDLGDQPPSNAFITPDEVADEQRFPLQVHLCKRCGLSQLVHVVHSEDIFDDYIYLSSTSKALCRHYEEMVNDILARFDPPEGALMVDIGANDGITLRCYPEGRYHVLGVEPSSAGEYARKERFEVVDAFFNAETAAGIAESHGKASIITATNVFAHVDDIVSFAKGVKTLLADDGIYVIEFPYVGDMLRLLYFDTIYHEHLCYLGFTPLKTLFDQVGLRMFDAVPSEIGASGPAKRLFVCKKEAFHETTQAMTAAVDSEADWGVREMTAYEEFAARVADVKSAIKAQVAGLKADGKKIGGYAAPAKGNTLLNYLGLGPGDIAAISENNAEKVGKVTPGAHIPIVGDTEFMDMGIDVSLLLAWNYADFFVENSDFAKNGGRFLVPLPEPVMRP